MTDWLAGEGRLVNGRLFHRHSLPLTLAVAMAVSFLVFGALAAVQFPRPYGPWHNNTLSQLGNVKLNPDGFVLYLIGCAVTGLLAIAFFLSLGGWRVSGSQHQNRLLMLVQVLGVAGGAGLFMDAVYPETQYAPHHFWTGVLFNSFAAAALLAVPALWRPGRANWVLISYNLIAFIAVILMFVFAGVHWVEWVPAGLFLLFPLVLGLQTRALEGTGA